MNLRVRGDEGVAGAIGNVGQLAGNPFSSSFVIPQQSRMEADRLFRQGMDNTESGRKIKENMQRVRQMLPQAMGIPDMMQMGNMASMGNIGNAGFFMGPQMGQGIPPGYMNKIVS
jgi:hypothetical protein